MSKVNDEGETTFNGLWEQIDGKGVTGEYELVETFAPEGYKLDKTPLRFTATRDSDGKLIFTSISGDTIIKENSETEEKEIESDKEVVTLNIVNKPIFNIYKYGDENVLLANAKFTITELNGDPAYGSDGNIIGTLENGKYVITTDSNGRISANLKKGAYKAVEIEAPEGYDLPANEKDRTYYFAIDESREPIISNKIEQLEWYKGVGGGRVFNAENGCIVYNKTKMTKFNKDGEIELEKSFKTDLGYTASGSRILDIHVKENENGYIITTRTNLSSIDFDDDTTINLGDGIHCISIYLDKNGNYVETKSFELDSLSNISTIDKNDNIILVDGKVYTRNGDFIEQKESTSIEYAPGSESNPRIIDTPNGYVKYWVVTTGSISTYNLDFTTYVECYNNNDQKIWSEKYRYASPTSSNRYQINKVIVKNNLIIVSVRDNSGGDDFFLIHNAQNSTVRKYEHMKCLSGEIFEYKDENGNSREACLIYNIDNNNYNYYNYNYMLAVDTNTCEELYKLSVSGASSYSSAIVDFVFSNDGNMYLTGYASNGNLTIYTNGDTATIPHTGGNYVLKLSSNSSLPAIPESKEISIYNNIKQYDITTEIAQNEQGQRTGGTVTGVYNDKYKAADNKQYVETVKHGKDSTEDILIQATEGYAIEEITVNGQKININSNNNRIYTLKAGYFENINENKHIIVKFSKTNYLISINKTNENNEAIEGAKFEIANKAYDIQLGELTANGPEKISKDGNIQYPDLLGSKLDKDENYYFEDVSGKYIPNNLGISNTTAWSCIPIDLTNYDEDYFVEVDCTTSGISTDSFSIYLSESEDATEGIALNNKVFYSLNKEGGLKGGKLYYLHFRYTRSSNTGSRTLRIDAIRLYKGKSTSYYFVEDNGAYQPNNIGVTNSAAWSYIPLDLTNCDGLYEIKVNAETNTPFTAFGPACVYVTDSTDVPNTSSTDGRVLRINQYGQTEASDYSLVFEGGKEYYIHLGYERGATSESRTAEFKISSLEVNQIITKYSVITGEDGIASVGVKTAGKYVVKEIEAPEGYVLSNVVKDAIVTDENPNYTVPYVNKKAKKVIVHHYLEGTGEEYNNDATVLSEDEIIYGEKDKPYTTAPNMEIEGYTLVKENGEYLIPENASGTIGDEDINVYYYYNIAPVKLVVHHYLDGTEDKLVEDEITNYNKGQHYKTEPSEDLLEAYDLVKVVGDEEKDITKDEEVIYYYAKKQHEITTKVETISYFGKNEKGGEITGENENPYEIVDHGDSNTKGIKMTPKDGFKIDQIVINQSENGRVKSSDEIDFAPEPDNTYELPQINNVKNDYEVVVRYVPDMGKVIVHHYIDGTTIKAASDEVIVDEYGNVIETEPLDENETVGTDSFRRFILVRSPSEPNVISSSEDQEVSYYYNVQYKITTEVVPHNEIVNGQTTEVNGGNISGENDNIFEVVMRHNDSSKVIKITPKEHYRITGIKINGETYDFSSKLDEDGTVTLDNFTDIDEDKHITVEFARIPIPAKVIVRYLEEGTNKVLKTEEVKNGNVGDEYTTTRATINGYEKAGVDPTNANGTMAENDIVVVYYYKKVEEHVEPTPVEPEVPDTPDVPVTPDEPEVPDIPDVPVTPDKLDVPDTPAIEEDEKDLTKDETQVTEPEQTINNNEVSPKTGDNIVKVIISAVIASITLLIVINTKTRYYRRH